MLTELFVLTIPFESTVQNKPYERSSITVLSSIDTAITQTHTICTDTADLSETNFGVLRVIHQQKQAIYFICMNVWIE